MINFHFSEIECSKIHNHKIFLSFESFQPIPNLKDKTSQTNFPNCVSCLRYIRRLRNDSDYVNLSAVPRSTINPPYEIRNKDRKTTPWWRSDSSSRKGKLSFSSIIRFYTCYFIFAFVNDKHRNGSGGCFFFFFFFGLRIDLTSFANEIVAPARYHVIDGYRLASWCFVLYGFELSFEY